VVVALALLHGATYHAVWLYQHEWAALALSQGPKFNFLAGSAALTCALLLWAAALPSLRGAPRFGYPFFKATHHIGFWGFLVFSAAHNFTVFWYCLPGLVLYFSEAAVRIIQSGGNFAPGGGCEVLHASAAADGAVTTLVVAAPAAGLGPAGVVWLSVPSLGRLEWHPFDYLAVPYPQPSSAPCADAVAVAGPIRTENIASAGHDAPPPPTKAATPAMVMQIKSHAGWTRRLAARVAAEGPGGVRGLRVQGPYADAVPAHSCRGEGVDGVAFIAGGRVLRSKRVGAQGWCFCQGHRPHALARVIRQTYFDIKSIRKPKLLSTRLATHANGNRNRPQAAWVYPRCSRRWRSCRSRGPALGSRCCLSGAPAWRVRWRPWRRACWRWRGRWGCA
jgi:hypothetical protein